tara:strand:- start:94 stop:435 length:342 start_codon:yes stop_codon:yes gene_type:complete
MEYTDLSLDDYRNILKYYDEPIPTSNKELRRTAELLMASKLCGCIKKIGKKKNETEARAIGICTHTIFNRKGIKRGSFKCRKRTKSVFMQKKKKTRKVRKSRKRRMKELITNM